MPIVAIGSAKGGTGKTSVAEELSVALADAGREVVILALDSNTSLHDRFVRPEDREPPAPGDSDEDPDADPRWPFARRLNRLLLEDKSPDVDGDYCYRRPDVPGVGVLFHEPGTLGGLAEKVRDVTGRRRVQSLLGWLPTAYDVVIVDTPADFENPLVVETLLVADLLLPVMDPQPDAFRAVQETFSTALVSDIPVAGLVLTRQTRRNERIRRTVTADANRFAQTHHLDVLEILEDAALTQAHADSTPLSRYRPARGRRSDGAHAFDRDPPRALAGFRDLAAWLIAQLEDPNELHRGWSRRKLAARAQTHGAQEVS